MSFKRTPKARSADQFIEGAATAVQAPPASSVESTSEAPQGAAASTSAGRAATGALPWEDMRDGKPTEVFNLRLTEVELEKLRFIAAHTPDSMQAFVRKVLMPALDARIDQLMR